MLDIIEQIIWENQDKPCSETAKKIIDRLNYKISTPRYGEQGWACGSCGLEIDLDEVTFFRGNPISGCCCDGISYPGAEGDVSVTGNDNLTDMLIRDVLNKGK